jgi:1,4-alpha-glucan branching enzyme
MNRGHPASEQYERHQGRGYLALILHAHLPFVRHPEYENALEENWLFECITEAYMPLLLMLDRLTDEQVDFRLTVSISPTLASMLADPLLKSRYLRRLDLLIDLSLKETARTKLEPPVNRLAGIYRKRLLEIKEAYVSRYRKDLTGAFRRLQKLGKIEIIATAATHGYLPLLSADPSAVLAQIRIGIDHYRKFYGQRPKGFWLPECAFYPGLDKILRDEGILYTILETHGLTRARPKAAHGVYAPLCCNSGLYVFGRDPDSSRQVWSSTEGYPGDFDYREFYRDIAYDLDEEYTAPYIHPAGIKIDTGFKYYRVTGKTADKEYYSPGAASKKAKLHASDFISKRISRLNELCDVLNRKPLFVAPFDSELFGHWWHEGPVWLEHLIRGISVKQKSLSLITLTEYLREYPDAQISSPSMSSWGERGYSKRWLNKTNDWIYRHLHHGAGTMNKLALQYPSAKGLIRRALNQACRELLLAQASDWAFMIEGGVTADYAAKRIKTHLIRIGRLAKQIETGTIDQEWLSAIEQQDNIFPEIDYRLFA